MTKDKVHVKKGDTVVVISGKDKGKKGKIIKVFPRQKKAIVEGVNIAVTHKKPSASMPQGGIMHQEAPIYTAKLKIYCNKCQTASRVGHSILADGKKVRICNKCNEILDK